MVLKRRRGEDDGRRGQSAASVRANASGRHAPKRRRETDVASPERDTNRLLSSAYAYLNRVRKSFGEDKQEYEQFTQLLRQFKEKRVHVEDVVNDVADLFRAYPSLLEGFAIYLPYAYRVLHDPTHFIRPRPPACLPIGPGPPQMASGNVLRARPGPPAPILHPVPRCHIHGALSPSGMVPLAYPFVPLMATWVTGAAVATLRLQHVLTDSLAAAAARRAVLVKESGDLTTALQAHGGVHNNAAAGTVRLRTRAGGVARRRKAQLPSEDSTLLVDSLNGFVPTLHPAQAELADAAWEAQHGHKVGLKERHARRLRIMRLRRKSAARSRNLRRVLRSYPQPSLSDAKTFLLSVALADSQGPEGADSASDSSEGEEEEASAFAAAMAAPPLVESDFVENSFGATEDLLVAERVHPAIASRQIGVTSHRLRLYAGVTLIEVQLTRTDPDSIVPPTVQAASPPPATPAHGLIGRGTVGSTVGPLGSPLPRPTGSIWGLNSIEVADVEMLRAGRVAVLELPHLSATANASLRSRLARMDLDGLSSDGAGAPSADGNGILRGARRGAEEPSTSGAEAVRKGNGRGTETASPGARSPRGASAGAGGRVKRDEDAGLVGARSTGVSRVGTPLQPGGPVDARGVRTAYSPTSAAELLSVFDGADRSSTDDADEPVRGGVHWAVAVLARTPFGLSDGSTAFAGDYLVLMGTSGAQKGATITSHALPHHTVCYIVRCPETLAERIGPEAALEAARLAALAEVAGEAAGAAPILRLSQSATQVVRSDVGMRPRLPKILEAVGRWRDGTSSTEELYIELNALLAGLPLLRFQLPQFFPGMRMSSVKLARPVGT